MNLGMTLNALHRRPTDREMADHLASAMPAFHPGRPAVGHARDGRFWPGGWEIHCHCGAHVDWRPDLPTAMDRARALLQRPRLGVTS